MTGGHPGGSARGGPDAVSTADPADAEGADTALRHLRRRQTLRCTSLHLAPSYSR